MIERTSDWLKEREQVDQQSRNKALLSQLSAHFALRDTIAVVDVACGIGANLRAICPHLPERQRWFLLVEDDTHLGAAHRHLSDWADHVTEQEHGLLLVHAGKTVAATFRRQDNGGAQHLPETFDLLTASGHFHRATERATKLLVNAAARSSAVFHASLTYNGQQSWAPRNPLDNQMRAAFHAYLLSRQGNEVLTGPTAPSALADALAMAGFSVTEGPSDWQLGRTDAGLIQECAHRYAAAVQRTGKLTDNDITRWCAIVRTGATIGHTDTLAFPPPSSTPDNEDDEPARLS